MQKEQSKKPAQSKQQNPRRKALFVDYENVRGLPVEELEHIVKFKGDVVLLAGPADAKIPTWLAVEALERRDSFRIVQTARSGRNALDMLLAFEVGFYVKANTSTDITVFSRDKDYDALAQNIGSATRFNGSICRKGTLSAPPKATQIQPADLKSQSI